MQELIKPRKASLCNLCAEISSAGGRMDVKWGERGHTETGEDGLELASVSDSLLLVTKRMMILQQIKDE